MSVCVMCEVGKLINIGDKELNLPNGQKVKVIGSKCNNCGEEYYVIDEGDDG